MGRVAPDGWKVWDVAEFDRNAAAVAELERLMKDPQEVFQVAEVAWTYTPVTGDGRWERLADLLAQGVADEYKLGKVDPRYPTDRASEAADSVVTGPNYRTRLEWLLVLDNVATLAWSDGGPADGDTFTVSPGQKLRDVITDGITGVLTQGAAALFRHTESVVDDLESTWEEAHAEPEPEPGAGEKHPADWV